MGYPLNPLLDMSFYDVMFIVMGTVALLNFFDSLFDVIQKTHMKPSLGCMFGLTPIFVFGLSVTLLFTQTEWASANPSLACLLLFPSYSLICSRQIICNVTKMEMETLPRIFLWFLLFPLNRLAPNLSRKNFMIF